jgi:hypothetical protein
LRVPALKKKPVKSRTGLLTKILKNLEKTSPAPMVALRCLDRRFRKEIRASERSGAASGGGKRIMEGKKDYHWTYLNIRPKKLRKAQDRLRKGCVPETSGSLSGSGMLSGRRLWFGTPLKMTGFFQ